MPTTAANTIKRIDVVVGLVENEAGQFLIALRDQSRHQGGLWEFPGGKVEPEEDEFSALARELFEEVGIDVTAAHYLHDIQHDYPDKAVCLKLWHITEFAGDAHGKEQQPILWVSPSELRQYPFPEANKPILELLVAIAK